MLSAVAVVLLLVAPASDIPVLTPDQAKDHVGQEVVVRGQLLEVGASENGDTLFLYFGGEYPDHVFNAVIFSQHFRVFPEARAWEGQIIEVRGKVQLYEGRGKPEIILERQEQVMIDSGTALPQGEGTEGGAQERLLTRPVMDYDQAPRPIKMTRPTYPREAFDKKIEGTVIVQILIDATGRVVRARVIQSVPLLDAAAVRTVYQWAFSPAVKHGQPVATLAHAPIAFKIDEKGEQALDQRKQRPAASSKTSNTPI